MINKKLKILFLIIIGNLLNNNLSAMDRLQQDAEFRGKSNPVPLDRPQDTRNTMPTQQNSKPIYGKKTNPTVGAMHQSAQQNPMDEEIQDLQKGGEKALRNKQSEELQQNQTANKQNQKIAQKIVTTKKLEDRYGKK